MINTEGQKKNSAHGQRFLLVFRYIRRNLFDFFHTVEECRVGCSVPAAIACGHETGSTAEGRCARRWVDSTAVVTAWCLPAFHRSLKLQSCAYSPRQSAACHPAGLPAHACNCCLARRLNGRPASSINPCNLQASKFLFLGCLVAINGEFVKRIFRLRRRLSGLYKRKDNKCAKHTNGYSSINVRKQTTKI